ncbi:MAG: alpha-N-acetylglucosaminidase [Bacteroidales bacterium]|nr:alpha-N-acetylglucosaminidase [Bacteroidales bacterium]
MTTAKKAFLALALMASCGSPKTVMAPDPDIETAEALAERIVPSYSDNIRFEHLPDTLEAYELESVGDRVVIRGSSALSMAVGLNRYLSDYCLTDVSWYASHAVKVPSEMPAVPKKVRSESVLPERFFLNYCTFGYTMPWWKWEDWERFIDWMALNGVTMPLAITGEEAVWQEVWRKHGLTDEETRSYFTGPAHLPWHRMCNIDGVDGPLPQGWIDGQVELQKKILERERSFGMKPVLPAFGGHVPAQLKTLYPDADISDIRGWGGFSKEYLPHFLAPTDPLFAEIQKEFLDAQNALFGTDHLYSIDLFNEIEAPSWDPETLAAYAQSTYGSMAAADHEARWVQSGWMFHYDRKHWTPENVKAYLTAIPEGKVILLDYYIEHTPVWTLTESFYDQPYILCYLGNFGGNTRISGPFATLGERIGEALQEGGDNLIGIGSTLEGFGVNPWIYEYVLDRAWDRSCDDEEWIARLADKRTGVKHTDVENIWKDLVYGCYVKPAISEGSLICGRPSFEGWWNWTVIHTPRFDDGLLIDLAERMSSVYSDSDAYRFDCVSIVCQLLGYTFGYLRDNFTAYYKKGALQDAQREASLMKALLSDIDFLAAAEPEFRLDRWIEAAEAFGETPEEKAYYARNARHIVSTWGFSKNLKDYGSRLWSGLISSYYAPRWEMWLDEVLDCMQTGREFSQEDMDRRLDEFERRWVEGLEPVPPATVPDDWKETIIWMTGRWKP